ncbi:MAG: hypothetical protein H0X43_09940 [Nitrosospira sp.]|nr:hypothetical protein [Nitrosospira sp.]
MLAVIGSAAALTIGSPAFAQQEGLVNVDISNVNTEIAKNINVDVSQIPVTVQAPIGVAANVCNVGANVLGEQARSGTGSCTAETTSDALNQIVQRQIKGTGQQ